jgi:hypothetical protein
MSDDELREYRNQMRAELQRLLGTAPHEATPEGTAYRVYYCTVYYTPRESGFTAERGFDDTRVTAPGLKGRRYPLAFLQAVKREGFGRLAEPVNGLDYLQYAGGGRYRFAKAPLGNRGNVLVPRNSCAISGTTVSSPRSGFARRFANGQEVTGSHEWLLMTPAEACTRSRSTSTGVKTILSVRWAGCARVRPALDWTMLST